MDLEFFKEGLLHLWEEGLCGIRQRWDSADRFSALTAYRKSLRGKIFQRSWSSTNSTLYSPGTVEPYWTLIGRGYITFQLVFVERHGERRNSLCWAGRSARSAGLCEPKEPKDHRRQGRTVAVNSFRGHMMYLLTWNVVYLEFHKLLRIAQWSVLPNIKVDHPGNMPIRFIHMYDCECNRLYKHRFSITVGNVMV